MQKSQATLRLPRDSALDQPVRIRLRRINFAILASVLQAFVPAQVYRALVPEPETDLEALTDFKIVLVW